jgi:hypothetical protein
MKTHGLLYVRIDHLDSLGANDPSISPPFFSDRRIAMCHVACQAKRKVELSNLATKYLKQGLPQARSH